MEFILECMELTVMVWAGLLCWLVVFLFIAIIATFVAKYCAYCEKIKNGRKGGG